ncbi:MAG: lactate racemase domain-containing protein [Chloroflexota bacterium]|nr:lactate racemase domain-containing protein [Chloroflexota bacterium]
MSQVTLRRDAWFGDRDVRFAFPDGWDVTVYPHKGAPTVSDAAIRDAFSRPIGTRRLAEIAAGKRSAAIIVDDLSRPTPAERIIPYVLGELHAAGVPDSGVRFVVGGGAHRPLTREEKARKVGEAVARKYPVHDHNTYSGTLAALGNLADGTPVYINEVVAQSEVKVAVAGIYPHPSAGLGGGAKIIVPGVAGISTILYNHQLFPGRGRGNLQRRGAEPDMRENAEAVARHLGLDMIVNTVVNAKREVAGVFVGDVVAAYEAGAKFASGVYDTPLPKQAVATTDIVFVNCYPQDMDPVQVGKSTWPLEVFTNAYKVVINGACDGIFYHGVSDKMDYCRFLETKDKRPKVEAPVAPAITSKGQMIMLSEHFAPQDFYRHNVGGALFASWDALVAALRGVCPKGKVAVIPTSPLQLPKVV